MAKLTLHARIEIGLVAALLLGSCAEGGGPVSRDEVIDIADDAIDASEIGSSIDNLESRLSDAESKATLNAHNIDVLFSNAAEDRETANDNAQIINRALDRIDELEARLGM